MKKRYLVLSICIIFIAAAIYADNTVTFSFASDDFHSGPTFEGGKNVLWGKAEVGFVIDGNQDFPGGRTELLSVFTIEAEMYDYRVFFIGSQYLHVWKIAAHIVFHYKDAKYGDPVILEIEFKEGVVTSWSPNRHTIGETMTIQNSESADQGIFFTPYNQLKFLAGYNLTVSEDLAFTLTNVTPVNDSEYKLIPVSEGYLKEEFKAEGSFSASVIPVKITPNE